MPQLLQATFTVSGTKYEVRWSDGRPDSWEDETTLQKDILDRFADQLAVTGPFAKLQQGVGATGDKDEDDVEVVRVVPCEEVGANVSNSEEEEFEDEEETEGGEKDGHEDEDEEELS